MTLSRQNRRNSTEAVPGHAPLIPHAFERTQDSVIADGLLVITFAGE